MKPGDVTVLSLPNIHAITFIRVSRNTCSQTKIQINRGHVDKDYPSNPDLEV